ncbi:MAG: hypothetical protein ACTIKR_09110 [Advenella sp.]|uniref:hypothetical protein n=1 Tax=Advenella sp. TaxID=1872388 RepID=UPI003F9C6F83
MSSQLRGQFKGTSEAKILDCLVRLRCEIQIVIGPEKTSEEVGHSNVLCIT